MTEQVAYIVGERNWIQIQFRHYSKSGDADEKRAGSYPRSGSRRTSYLVCCGHGDALGRPGNWHAFG